MAATTTKYGKTAARTAGKSAARSSKAVSRSAASKPAVKTTSRLVRTTMPLAHNMLRLGHLDLAGGGQVYVQGNTAFIGHMDPPHGTSVIDIKDPKRPKVIAELPLDGDRSHTHKVRVVGDLMITNVEQNHRHATRAAAQLVEAEARLEGELGRPPKDAELAAALHIKPNQVKLAREFLARPYAEGGFKVWDVSNPKRPQLLSYVKTHGFGVHRFDMDERYAYISTEMDGYVGNILVIYDLKNPAQPEEVSRWWMPGQHVAGGEVPTWKGYKNRLHHTMRHGNELWAAVWNAGLRVIDVTDIRHPRTIGAYDYHPPFPEPTHTVLKVPFEVAGRDIAIACDEEHDHVPGHLHAGLWVFDVADRANIAAISMYHVSEHASPFSQKGRFGMHQFQEHLEDTRLFCTWFSGGLRVIDIKDPTAPVETGWFIPEPVGGHAAPQTNDVDVDKRGLVFTIDRNAGFDIIEPGAGTHASAAGHKGHDH